MAPYPPPSHRNPRRSNRRAILAEDNREYRYRQNHDHDHGQDRGADVHWALQGAESMPSTHVPQSARRQYLAMALAGLVLVAAIVIIVVLPAFGHQAL